MSQSSITMQNPAIIPNNDMQYVTDMNILSDGIQWNRWNGNSANAPVTGTDGFAITMGSGKYYTQFAVAKSSEAIYVRSHANGNWGRWYRFIPTTY